MNVKMNKKEAKRVETFKLSQNDEDDNFQGFRRSLSQVLIYEKNQFLFLEMEGVLCQ